MDRVPSQRIVTRTTEQDVSATATLQMVVTFSTIEKVGRTPAQVTLRWHVQRGDIIFPKSSSPERMAENFAIFDFELDEEQVAAITALDQGEKGRTGPNPDEFDYIPD